MTTTRYSDDLVCKLHDRNPGRATAYRERETTFHLLAPATTRGTPPRLVAVITLVPDHGPAWAVTLNDEVWRTDDRPYWDTSKKLSRRRGSFRSKRDAIEAATRAYAAWRRRAEPDASDEDARYAEALVAAKDARASVLKHMTDCAEQMRLGAEYLKETLPTDETETVDLHSAVLNILSSIDDTVRRTHRSSHRALDDSITALRAQTLIAERRAIIGPERAKTVEDHLLAARMAARLRGEKE